MDHYQYLEVGRASSPNQINAAARMAIWRNRGDAAETERIMAAWYIVGDTDRRFDYDFWLLTDPPPGEQYPSVERRAAAELVPEAEPPRAAADAVKQRRVLGPPAPDRVFGPPFASAEAEPAMSVMPAGDRTQSATAAATRIGAEPPPSPPTTPPDASPAAQWPFDPEQLSWWHEAMGRQESVGPGHNGLRLLVKIGIIAMVLGPMINPVILAPSVATVLPIVLSALALILLGRLWPRAASRRAVNQRVFGIGGGALSEGRSRFSKENVAKGVAGERRTALALEALLRIPGTRIFHGLRFPGSTVADIDHAVVNGDRVLFIDSKFWKPGEYRWLDADKLGYVRGRRVDRRDIHMDHVQRHPLTSKAAAEVGCHVLIHPNAEGAITFTPGGHISPTGIPATDIQDGMEMIGRWLLQCPKSGFVDRYVMARMIAMLK
ncbi:NERD domain-containing protein [Paeniglutamicibacter sp.]|uniref:nuclease-related domain-containing protein n=1 Tax=Paeniglutamicibacter sp. TaxID=1934391 RepID=UPI003988B77C